MDGLEIARHRLHNQHLTGRPLPDPVRVVQHMGAVQAQEYAVARWSLAQRTTGADDAAVQRLIDDGAIVRTHALRPTWHFVAAEDLRWIQAVTGCTRSTPTTTGRWGSTPTWRRRRPTS